MAEYDFSDYLSNNIQLEALLGNEIEYGVGIRDVLQNAESVIDDLGFEVVSSEIDQSNGQLVFAHDDHLYEFEVEVSDQGFEVELEKMLIDDTLYGIGSIVNELRSVFNGGM